MRACDTRTLVALLIGWLLFDPIRAAAEWGYGASGNLGTGLVYNRQQQGESRLWTMERRDDYSLGVTGKILDPRLATFNLAGALSMSDLSSNQKQSANDSRLLSFMGNLSLLSGKPYPLDLRFSQSSLASSTDTNVLSYGGSWRVVYGSLPSLFLNLDRVNIESAGQARADTSFTTGTLRLAKRIFSSDLDAEFGLQNFSDNIRGASTLRHFGRLSDTTLWSQATTLRFSGDYFLQEETRSLGSTFSLLNRPDPTLSRSLSFAVRNLAGKEQGQTTLDASGAISKAFEPFQTLSITPFTTALLSQRFASGAENERTLVISSSGLSLVSRYFPSVLAIGDYGLGLSYNREDATANIGTTQRFHVGLLSLILQPYRVRGDYTFTLERTLTDRNRHLASLRADGPIATMLHFRTFLEWFNDEATFSGAGTRLAAQQNAVSFGGGITYTGIYQLYFDLGANLQRMENEVSSTWLSRLTANLNYRPRDRITLMLTGLRESDTLNRLARFEISPRVIYQFGRATVNLEYRFETRKVFDQPGQGYSIMLRINRPFRFSF
jgi:hypothetical protein